MVSQSGDSLSLYENRLQNPSISIISIPLELGSDARGLAATPEYLYKHGLEHVLTTLGIHSLEKISIPCPAAPAPSIGQAKNIREIASVAEATATVIKHAAAKGNFVLSLGGDHAVSIGTVSGGASAHKRLGVIWIDAHPDANTVETSLTGNVHGMPAAALMGFGDPLLAEIAGTEPKIRTEDFLYLGLKDFDQAEIDFIRREHVAAVTMFDITEHHLTPVVAAINDLRGRVDAVWVSMDMDSIDVAYAPGVAMPNTAGFTKREILAIAQYIGKTCTLAGLDIVEMLPEKDVGGVTAALALELVGNFLGGNTGWYQEYMQNYEEIKNITQVSREVL